MKRLFIFCFLMLAIDKIHAQEIPNARVQDTIYNIVDTLPSFDCGDAGWKKYLKKNLKYPRYAWREELEADVTMDFIVRKDGTLTDIHYVTIVGYGFEEEATRLMKNCGRWNPAIKNGRKVDYHAQLPIIFKLKNHD